MNLQQGDILVRNYDGTQTVWLSQRLVMEVCGVLEKYLRKKRTEYKQQGVRECDLAKSKDFMPKGEKAWRWAKTSNGFYYCLDNIPNKAPKHYRELFGDKEALLQSYEQAMANRHETSLETMFKRHLNKAYPQYLEYYTQVDTTRRVALAKACGVLDFLLENVENYSGTKNALFNELSPILQRMDLAYIPHNPLRLKEKYNILLETDHSIVELINLPRTGNKNAEQYNDQEVYSWVMQLRASGANFSDQWIVRYVWELCDRFGKKKPSRRWFGQTIFEQPKTKYLTAEKRFGYGSRKSKMYAGYIPMKNAIYAGDCWEVDATRVNIIAHQTQDEHGKKCEKYLYVIVVRDLHSGDILGYDIAYAENKNAYMRALRMAVETANYLPYSLVTDRFPGHNTDEIKDLFARMEALGVQIHTTHKASGKAGVERWFGTFQSVRLMGTQFYYGEGIQSRRLSAHRSDEFLNEVKKQAKKDNFDYFKAYQEIEMQIELWRDTPYCTYSRKYENVQETPKQLHEKAMKTNVIDVNPARISMLFHRKKQITLKNNGLIETEIDKTKFYYRLSVADYEVISNYTGQKVIMSYDVFESNVVYLWKKHEHLLVSLCKAELFEEVQGHGPTAELGRISEARAREKELQRLKEAELQQAMQGSESDLLMGIFTDKKKANAAEDAYLSVANSQESVTPQPIKKVANSDVDFEDEIQVNHRNMM